MVEIIAASTTGKHGRTSAFERLTDDMRHVLLQQASALQQRGGRTIYADPSAGAGGALEISRTGSVFTASIQHIGQPSLSVTFRIA